jgi:transcriptional regulator with XRE-family HTH domain
MTQAQLAEAVHIHRHTIGMYENDKRLPDADILAGLVTVLGCDVYWLLGIERKDEQMEPIVNAVWKYYTNDEGKARWKCSKCGKLCRRDPHEKKRCSCCGAHMRTEA